MGFWIPVFFLLAFCFGWGGVWEAFRRIVSYHFLFFHGRIGGGGDNTSMGNENYTVRGSCNPQAGKEKKILLLETDE